MRSPILLVPLALAVPAAAQCPEWTPGLRTELTGSAPRVFATFDDGRGPAMYAGGSFVAAGDVLASRVVRWDGVAFEPLGAGTDGTVLALAAHDDGSGPALYAGGTLTTAGGMPAAGLARWNGTSWSTLGAGLEGEVDLLGSYAGDLVALGAITGAGGQPAAGFALWDGASWSAPAAGAVGLLRELAVFDAGGGPDLWLCGDFTAVGGVSATNIARWNGSSWSAGGEPDGQVLVLEVFDDGSGSALYAGGTFSTIGAVPANGIARFDGSSWSQVGSGLDGPVSGLVVFDDGGGPALYAKAPGPMNAPRLVRWNGSTWTVVPGTIPYTVQLTMTTVRTGAVERIAVAGVSVDVYVVDQGAALWDGAQWTVLGGPDNGIQGPVRALAAYDAGSGPELYAGGAFTIAGGRFVNDITRWSGTEWQSLDGGMDNPNPKFMPPEVRALAVHDDGSGLRLYAGGDFEGAGGAFDFGYVARWDGASWSAMGTGVSAPVHALCSTDLGAGPVLVLGGEFVTTTSGPAAHVATWDGTAYAPLGDGVNDTVLALAVYGGELYAAGAFTQAEGAPAAHVARWDGMRWTAVGTGFDATVRALCVFDDGGGPDLYAGGDFALADGQPASRIARWNGAQWSPLGSGVTGSDPVRVSALADAGGALAGRALVVGGRFTEAGGAAANALARWNGGSWSGFSEAPNGEVTSLAVLGDALWVGGGFWAVGQTPSTNVARLTDPCAASTQGPFCEGTEALCPCGNAGTAGAGCDNGQGTGGVLLSLASFMPDGLGGGTATLAGTGFPPAATPTFVALRASGFPLAPQAFGDGLLCVGPTSVVRVGSGAASLGSAQAALSHGAGAGSFYYQLWYRSQPAAFCDPAAAFNLSNGYEITW